MNSGAQPNVKVILGCKISGAGKNPKAEDVDLIIECQGVEGGIDPTPGENLQAKKLRAALSRKDLNLEWIF